MNFFLGVSTNQEEPWNTNQQNAARLYMYVANYIISVLTRNFRFLTTRKMHKLGEMMKTQYTKVRSMMGKQQEIT